MNLFEKISKAVISFHNNFEKIVMFLAATYLIGTFLVTFSLLIYDCGIVAALGIFFVTTIVVIAMFVVVLSVMFGIGYGCEKLYHWALKKQGEINDY